MRTLIAWTLTLAVGAWAAGSASGQATQPATKRQVPAGKAAQAAPVDPAAIKARQDAELQARQAMDDVLAQWEKKSKKIISLDVAFEKVERNQGFGDQFYQGRAMLQSPDLACLEFRKVKLDANGKPLMKPDKDGKPVVQLEKEPYERIVCTGKEVLQYDWNAKKVFVFPLQQQARQKALQQGPLPFLFNLNASEARQRYSMSLLKQNNQEFLIGIVPNEEIDRGSFTQAFLWLSKETFLPNKLVLFPVGEKNPVEYRFTGENAVVRANTPMDKNYFAFSKIPGWKVIINPGENGEAPAANAAPAAGDAQPRRPVAQPAMRPAPASSSPSRRRWPREPDRPARSPRRLTKAVGWAYNRSDRSAPDGVSRPSLALLVPPFRALPRPAATEVVQVGSIHFDPARRLRMRRLIDGGSPSQMIGSLPAPAPRDAGTPGRPRFYRPPDNTGPGTRRSRDQPRPVLPDRGADR